MAQTFIPKTVVEGGAEIGGIFEACIVRCKNGYLIRPISNNFEYRLNEFEVFPDAESLKKAVCEKIDKL